MGWARHLNGIEGSRVHSPTPANDQGVRDCKARGRIAKLGYGLPLGPHPGECSTGVELLREEIRSLAPGSAGPQSKYLRASNIRGVSNFSWTYPALRGLSTSPMYFAISST